MLILRVVHAFRMVYMSSLGYVLEPPLFTVTSLDNTYVRVIPFLKLEWPWVTLKRGCVHCSQYISADLVLFIWF